jgi:multidrug transporter EmrE-like cation transporter
VKTPYDFRKARKPSPRKDAIFSALFVLSLYFFVPILLAKLLLGASWREVGMAYGVWTAGLFVFGVSQSKDWGERLGWPMIIGMFLSIPAIPILVHVLRVTEVV